MKRVIVSILLIFSLLLSCSAIALAEGEGTEASTDAASIVLRPENMIYDSKYAKVAEDPGVEGYVSGKYIYLYKALAAGTENEEAYYVKMNINIPVAGTYYVWATTKDFEGNKPGTRWAKLAVDGVKNSYEFNSDGLAQAANGGKTGYRWEMGFSVELTAGKHTVDIVEWKAACRLNAIMLTSDATLDPNTLDYSTVLSTYEDIDTVPEFAEEEITIDNYDEQSVIATWSAATDTKGLYGYNVYVNDVFSAQLGIDEKSYIISGLKNLDKIDVRVEAVDMHGHSASIGKTGYFSDIELSEVKLVDENQDGNLSLSDFVDKDEVYACYTLENKSNSAKNLLLGLAIYDKNTGAMIKSTRETVTLEGNERKDFTLLADVWDEFAAAPENYRVYAAVWDTSETMVPQTIGVLIEEGEE